MNILNYARIAGQAVAIGAVVRQIRRAQDERDNLQLLDAVVNFLAVATTIAILIREIRNRRSENDMNEDVG